MPTDEDDDRDDEDDNDDFDNYDARGDIGLRACILCREQASVAKCRCPPPRLQKM